MGDDMHQRHLTEANRHIAAGLQLVAGQQSLVERLENDLLDAFEARKLLCLFEETLALMQAHRKLIRRTTDRRP